MYASNTENSTWEELFWKKTLFACIKKRKYKNTSIYIFNSAIIVFLYFENFTNICVCLYIDMHMYVHMYVCLCGFSHVFITFKN